MLNCPEMPVKEVVGLPLIRRCLTSLEKAESHRCSILILIDLAGRDWEGFLDSPGWMPPLLISLWHPLWLKGVTLPRRSRSSHGDTDHLLLAEVGVSRGSWWPWVPRTKVWLGSPPQALGHLFVFLFLTSLPQLPRDMSRSCLCSFWSPTGFFHLPPVFLSSKYQCPHFPLGLNKWKSLSDIKRGLRRLYNNLSILV